MTAGPTHEAIDPVRFLGNPSSGKMGYAVARAAEHRGAQVMLVSGPSCLDSPPHVEVIRVQSASEMAQAVFDRLPQVQILVKAAAVADYRPKAPATHKIKKGDEEMSLALEKTQDILKQVGRQKENRFVVGFAAETEALDQNATQKLTEKNLDIIAGNLVGTPASGFQVDTNQVTLYFRDGTREQLPAMDKAGRCPCHPGPGCRTLGPCDRMINMAAQHPDSRSHKNVRTIFREIERTLKQMAANGCKGFDCSSLSLETLERWQRPGPGSVENLETIRRELGVCQRCALAGKRQHIVFGAGSAGARLVFVGEGPGSEEDRQGLPFVGAAGQLLSKIIVAMKLSREEVYICNIIKCRPPANRNPAPAEIKACFPFLERQLAVIQPEFICALGSFAAQTLLNTSAPISRLRGSFHDYHGIKVLPTYHPAYLLRNPAKKRAVWEDMQLLMQAMGISIDE